jgi:short-subunit dehydrogenase
VLITGTSTGIGQAAALYLATKGYRVYAAVRKEKYMHQFESHSNILTIILDVTKQDHIDRAAVELKKDLDQQQIQLVGLINNAGINGAFKPVELVDLNDVRALFEVNIVSVFAVTQKFLPLIRASKGRVINISSLSGLLSAFCQSAYSGSKWAMEAFSDALRQEQLLHGVSVSNINPSLIHTPILDKVVRAVTKPSHNNAENLYRNLTESFVKSVQNNSPGGKFKGSTTVETNKAILAALTDRFPETNYLVGTVDDVPAWVYYRLHWFVPKRMFDKLVAVQD